MSYLVTNPLLEEYGITHEQLYADAVQSMTKDMQQPETRTCRSGPI